MIRRLTMLPLLAALGATPALAGTVKAVSLPFPVTHGNDLVVGYINSCPTSSGISVTFKNGVSGAQLKQVTVTAGAHLGKTVIYRPASAVAAMSVVLEINCPFDPPGTQVSITIRDFASKSPLMSVGLAP